ncbi:MAG TPA: hypothetical protein VF533_23480 [Solirubrobacteraceae bacterium]
MATADPGVLAGGPDDLSATVAAWTARAIGPLEVRHDDTYAASEARAGGSALLLLGIAMDVERPELGQDEVVAGLAHDLDASWARFLDAIDRLSGAHVIFALSEGRLRVLQDATGIESVCYDVSGRAPFLASHPALMAELGGYRASEWGRAWLGHEKLDAGGIYFPGLRTLYDEVRILTPNTALDAGTLTVERFFPREPLGTVEVDEIVERTAPMLTAQCRWLTERMPCIVSLTGGLDSRLTLAATREVKDRMRYFTYVVWGNPVHENDVAVAEKLAARLGLTHETWRVSRAEKLDPAFLELWRRTHDGAQGNGKFNAGIVPRYPEGHLHIRSNVLETMRGFYLKNRVNHPDRFTAHKLSRLFRQGTAAEFEPYFEEMLAVTEFTPERKLDIHYTDLFYWEHRLGGFHGGMVRGMKVSHNTYVLYNCRNLLKLLMARPLPERAAGTVVYRLIEHLWPEVLEEAVYSGARFVDNPLRAGAPVLEEPVAPAVVKAPAAIRAPALAPEPKPAPASAAARASDAAKTLLELPVKGKGKGKGKSWTAGQIAREVVRRSLNHGDP